MQLTLAMQAVCGALAFSFWAGLANAQVDQNFKFARAWDRSPAVVEVSRAGDIIAIGDAHGDPRRLLGVLKASGVIAAATPDSVKPSDLKWTGGYSTVVVTGDMIDKAPAGGSSVRVVALLRALQASADAGKQGRVIILMGNHEAEFLANPVGKPDDLAGELKAAQIDPRTVANCQDPSPIPASMPDVAGLGKFLCELPFAARVREWFFSHAGDTNGRTLAQLTTDIQAAFQSRAAFSGFLNDANKNTILEARLNENEPGRKRWIDKPLTAGGKADPPKLLNLYLKNLSTQTAPVRYIVQGHQPGKVAFPDGVERKKHDMFQRYGTLFLVDSGMSASNDDSKKPKENSSGGVLLVRYADYGMQGATDKEPTFSYTIEASVICANGKKAMFWDTKTKQSLASQHCSP